MNKKELVAKLEEISALYMASEEVRLSIEAFVPDGNYSNKVCLPLFPGQFDCEEDKKMVEEGVDHSRDDAVKAVVTAYSKLYAPKMPEAPKLEEYNKEKLIPDKGVGKKISLFNYLSIICVIFGITIALGGLLGGEAFCVILGIIMAVSFVPMKYLEYKTKKDFEDEELNKKKECDKQNDERIAEYEARLAVYKREMERFMLRLDDFIEVYEAWRRIYLEKIKEDERIAEEYENARLEVVVKLMRENYSPAIAKLEKANDILDEEYLPVIDRLIGYLKEDKADTLEEAIDIYEEEKFFD